MIRAVHDEAVTREFAQQAVAFDRAAVMRSPAALDRLLQLLPARTGERWLEVACGTGIIARAIAPRVGEVVGIDLTPAMLEIGEREAERAGLHNVRFARGDATALEWPDGSFDGAVTRFSLHHIPVPGRVFAELARVVRRGGSVIVGDHLTDRDGDHAAWHQEIERLRDPSHWACLSLERLRDLGAQAGLTLEHEYVLQLTLDFDEWLSRGSGGQAAGALIERCLAERPNQSGSFRVYPHGQAGRVLALRYWLSRWSTG